MLRNEALESYIPWTSRTGGTVLDARPKRRLQNAMSTDCQTFRRGAIRSTVRDRVAGCSVLIGDRRASKWVLAGDPSQHSNDFKCFDVVKWHPAALGGDLTSCPVLPRRLSMRSLRHGTR